MAQDNNSKKQNNNYIVNLTDLNDSVVLNHIKNTSSSKNQNCLYF